MYASCKEAWLRVRLLVTGGGGFIGSHLAELVAGDCEEITLLDMDFRNRASANCKFVAGDVLDFPLLSKEVAGKDIIVHLAAVSRVEWGEKDPLRCLKTNVEGSLNLLEATAAKAPKAVVILGSSREVFGEPETVPVRETALKRPISTYGVSKLTAENLVSLYGRNHGLSSVILRFSNVYGSPRDLSERVVPKFMNLALASKPLTVYGGDQVLDFTFIDDVVAGIREVVKKAYEGDDHVLNQDFTFTSGKGTTILELAALVKDITRSESQIVRQNLRRYDVQRFIGDCSKAEKLLGYSTKHSLRDGLSKYRDRLIGNSPGKN